MDFAHIKIHISDMLYYYDQRLSKSMMSICVEITILEYAFDKVHDNKHSKNRIPLRNLIKYINCQIHCNIIVEYTIHMGVCVWVCTGHEWGNAIQIENDDILIILSVFIIPATFSFNYLVSYLLLKLYYL